MIGAPDSVRTLVENFKRNYSAYKSGDYKEEQLKQEFLNPLFEGLGWDVTNKEGNAPQYRDVIFEDSIKVASGTQAPDYCFTLSGVRKFFVEAKKPSVDVQNDQDAVYQLRRYAWSAKLPLSVLTNFETFAIYESKKRPRPDDKASTERIKFLTYEEFANRWSEIAGIFSKKAVRQGSFDKFAETTEKKRGTQEVDDEFLNEIEKWRDDLAKNIALRNPTLSIHDLNYSVQRTIDRIVFLRMCEARGIEPYGQLQALPKSEHTYEGLCQVYRRSDEKYNSGLFHFDQEKGRNTPPDEITLRLGIDDAVLRGIIKDLYYPDSPYEFSVLPPEILGNIYERFLGKVIRLTEGHHAKVEEKPEVKKAGGVYYTPKYIVDYIVENTVGKLCEGKSPKAVSEFRILDPACGSGSFLLGAYAFLLKYHLDYYTKQGKPDRFRDQVYQGRGGVWYLTIKEKKRILLNNIYGVDIDPQAVEVTKLSLLLKVLEGENKDVFERQQKLFRERALPDLDNNIKWGNSVIGTDFYRSRQTTLDYDLEDRYRIRAFDWDNEFPRTSEHPECKFDAVIGNPPYVFGRDWKALDIGDDVKAYLRNSFPNSPYQMDMFSIFMEKAMGLVCDEGYVGQIVPNVWLNNTYSSQTRSFLLKQSRGLILAVPPPGVFQGATVDTIVYVLQRSTLPGQLIRVEALDTEAAVSELTTLKTKDFADGTTPIPATISPVATKLVSKVKGAHPDLGSFADVTRGVHPYRVGGYGQTAFGKGVQTSRDIEERPYNSRVGGKGYRPFVYGKDLLRFTPPVAKDYIKYGPWLAEPRDARFFEGERIYSRKILDSNLRLTIERGDSVADQQVYITKPNHPSVKAAYLAGILGSKLMAFYIRKYFNEEDQAFPQIKVGQLRSLPIPKADCDGAEGIAQVVERILQANKSKSLSTNQQLILLAEREISGLEAELDKLVYELYGLTPEDIKTVEGRDR